MVVSISAGCRPELPVQTPVAGIGRVIKVRVSASGGAEYVLKQIEIIATPVAIVSRTSGFPGWGGCVRGSKQLLQNAGITALCDTLRTIAAFVATHGFEYPIALGSRIAATAGKFALSPLQRLQVPVHL